MLSPKRTKYRKSQRHVKTMFNKATRGNTLAYGDYGLMSMEAMWITNRQLEAARIALTRHIKRGGKVWIRVYPDMPFTKKPAETRMGKGKGTPEYWVAVVKKGVLLYEVAGVPAALAEQGLQLASSKLPIKTKIVKRRNLEE